MMPWRVVVVDDIDEFRSLMRVLVSLDPDFEVVGEASDGLAAIDLVRSVQPDAVLLDARMPGVDGFAALTEIRRTSPRSAVVMMSASTEPDLKDAALRAGADGFHLKSPETALRLTRDLREVMDTHLAS